MANKKQKEFMPKVKSIRTRQRLAKAKFYIMTVFLIFFAVGFFFLVHENSIQREKIDSALDLSRYYENRCGGLEENYDSFGVDVSKCDVYYPIVIEDYSSNNSMYVDENFITYNGKVPEYNGDGEFMQCIGFKYSNSDVFVALGEGERNVK